MRIERSRSFSSLIKHFLVVLLRRRQSSRSVVVITGLWIICLLVFTQPLRVSPLKHKLLLSSNNYDASTLKSIVQVVPSIKVDEDLILSSRPFYFPPYSTKTNAIIYLAQKSHKVYLRDSMALLFKSLNLLFQNYLLINDHYLNATVFIFHTGDFTEADLDEWERLRLYPSKCRGTLQLINLLGSPYWKTPSHLNETDLIRRWSNPKFNLGYRHM